MQLLLRRAAAEAIGTYALVTAGCGAIVVNSSSGALGHSGIAANFGLVIMVMIAATGHLSGAHFNSAVTTAFAVARHFAWRDVPVYLAAQMFGATAGAVTLRLLFGAMAGLGATVPTGDALQSFGLEILLSAMLMFVITTVATDTRAVGQFAVLAIGATVALDALWGGPIIGASMNPAIHSARHWWRECGTTTGSTGWGHLPALSWVRCYTNACARRYPERAVNVPRLRLCRWRKDPSMARAKASRQPT